MSTIKMFLKQKGGKYQTIGLAPPDEITPPILRTWAGQPAVLEYATSTSLYYAYGNEEVKSTFTEEWLQAKRTLANKPVILVGDISTFADMFWPWRFMQITMDIFGRAEAREERQAIMAAEKVSENEQQKVLAAYPELYQSEIDFIVPDDF